MNQSAGPILAIDAAGGDIHVGVLLAVGSEVVLGAGRDDPQGGRPCSWTDHRLHVAGVAAVLVAVGVIDSVVDVIAGLDEADVPLATTRVNADRVAGLRGARFTPSGALSISSAAPIRSSSSPLQAAVTG